MLKNNLAQRPGGRAKAGQKCNLQRPQKTAVSRYRQPLRSNLNFAIAL